MKTQKKKMPKMMISKKDSYDDFTGKKEMIKSSGKMTAKNMMKKGKKK